ncbi:MAG: fatty acid desaturase, partial [Polynucleobacter sp.]|nr:fatty acid desaturase [Polynucleobacter sp.]
MSTHLNSSLADPSVVTPLAPTEPLPHRKIIRSWLIPMAQGQTGRALLLLLIDACLWLAAIAGTVFFESLLLKIACGIVAGFVTGRIFI